MRSSVVITVVYCKCYTCRQVKMGHQLIGHRNSGRIHYATRQSSSLLLSTCPLFAKIAPVSCFVCCNTVSIDHGCLLAWRCRAVPAFCPILPQGASSAGPIFSVRI